MLETQTAQIVAERGLDVDGYVLFPSRLTKAKGVDDLIDGFAGSSAPESMRLVIAGNGPDAASMREQAQAVGLGDRVLFLHDVDDAEKSHLMAGSAAYVLASKPRPEFIETFDIALVEKVLAGGGPVITTATGGIPEAVDDVLVSMTAADRRMRRQRGGTHCSSIVSGSSIGSPRASNVQSRRCVPGWRRRPHSEGGAACQ